MEACVFYCHWGWVQVNWCFAWSGNQRRSSIDIYGGLGCGVKYCSVVRSSIFIVLAHDRLGIKLFPSWIRPARKPERVRRIPLLWRLSLPAGLVLGVVLAGIGTNDTE